MSRKVAIIFNILIAIFFITVGIITIMDDPKSISAYLNFATAALLCFAAIYFIRIYIKDNKEKK